MTRPAEGPGTPQREMVTLDRIRLIGLLKENPAFAGFSHSRAALRCITRASHGRVEDRSCARFTERPLGGNRLLERN